jgi:NAD(P)-dependent dehydrogenase (short-subunit alcohol dehydrogenase family)
MITGAGSGLGRNLAFELVRRGYQVFGTAASKAEIDDLAAATAGMARLTLCDITLPTEVLNMAAAVSGATDGKLDLLVSNAGILTPGPLETMTLTAVRREFEVNTFAVLTVINAFLPALREANGRVVQVSTMSVDFPSPFNGLSSASKAAAEAFMTVYKAELAASGVEVLTAVCGNMRTGGPAKTAAAIEHVRSSFTPGQREVYEDMFDRFAMRMNTGQAHGLDADLAAKQIADLAERHPAPTREPIGDDARTLMAYVRQTTAEEQFQRRLKSIETRNEESRTKDKE